MNRIENMWYRKLFTDVTIECPAHIGNCNYCEDYNDSADQYDKSV